MLFRGANMSAQLWGTGALVVAMCLFQTPSVQAAAVNMGLSSARGLVSVPVQDVGYRHHRRGHVYRSHRSNRNNGALVAGLAAVGVIAAIASANAAPAYYAPSHYYTPAPAYYAYNQPHTDYQQYPVTTVQYGGYDGYYDDDDYRPVQQRYQRRYYNKEAAKQYWKRQKEIQKRAIKRGYYSQPAYQQRNRPNSYDYPDSSRGYRQPRRNSYN
jgi:hypothetical protein